MPLVQPESIKGMDDAGNFYASHSELEQAQAQNKGAWYAANDKYWQQGGYGGATDDECMVGDTGGQQDSEEGLDFLDRLLSARASHNNSNNKKKRPLTNAIDAGSGVGRITKNILLRRFDSIRLIEADPDLSKRSRTYLGHKRSRRCTFTCSRLEELDFESFGGPGADLIWLQWTLQYLTDLDVVDTLRNLANILLANTGIMVIKENRPFGMARADRFQMDTPDLSGRYDITRSDAHHRLLFQRAGLKVDHSEEGEETNTYAVSTMAFNK